MGTAAEMNVMNDRVRTPPGPARFAGFRKFNYDPPQFMYELFQTYGDIVRWRGTFDVYLINHPDYARRVLSADYTQFSKRTIDYRVLATIMGNGLVSNDGAHWAKQRKLMQPMFAHRVVNRFDEPINNLTRNLIDEWEDMAGREPVWVDRDMGRLTFQIVGATLFGSDIDEYAEEMGQILDIVNLQTQEFRALMTLYSWIPTPYNLKWRRARKRLDEIVYGMIGARRQANRDAEHDILDRLLAARDDDDGSTMSETQMRDEVVTLMLAGHETSSTALAWTLHLLATHPDVEERLFEELTARFHGEPAQSGELIDVPYLKQVVQESMRIFPPVWAIARRSHQAEMFGDYEVPANAYIGIVPYALHRHRDFWPDPEKFDPERFDPSGDSGRHSYAYIPFAAGPRACIGLGMAMLEIQLVLAQLVQHFRFESVEGHPVETMPKVTLRHRHGLPLHLIKR